MKTGSRLSRLGFNFKPGDRVALHHHVPCMDCHFCRHHAFAQCATTNAPASRAGFEPAGGGYAEYVRVMDFVLPRCRENSRQNSFEEGALLEPVNTILKAVKRLNLLPGDSVLVAGQGPIGLMFTRILKLRGINVLATDLLKSRLKLSQKIRGKMGFSSLSTLNSQLSTGFCHHRCSFRRRHDPSHATRPWRWTSPPLRPYQTRRAALPLRPPDGQRESG